MVVGTSPRLRDSLDYEEPEATDHRFSLGFGSLSIAADEYEQHEFRGEHGRRAFAGTLDPSASRRNRRRRKDDHDLNDAVPFQYRTIADGEAFRVAVLLPGKGNALVECRLVWESSKYPQKDYTCLSYCWETTERTAAILCDGYRFPVTKNLLKALQNLRKPTTDIRIWIDQICINQDDPQERGHQVSIMKHIFSRAKEVIVWLGEEDDKSSKLCEYAKKMPRGGAVLHDSPKSGLNRILKQRQLQDALQKLLQRRYFSRVWVIPEVALARFTVVKCGKDSISWDNLVRLVRDTPLPPRTGFDKQTALLGNVRQRIAIITQMIASQREGLLHTDITQLIVLAKSSQATDVRDTVYAFYGLTLLTTFPDYRDIPDHKTSVERLYTEITIHYVNSILFDDYYTRWHGLSEQKRIQQLTSILYGAGRLHQHYDLPSWVPDWTFQWYQAPIWCKADSNLGTPTPRDGWSDGIRSNYRAGGERLETFEILTGLRNKHRLRLSAIIVDKISEISEVAPAFVVADGPTTSNSLPTSAASLDTKIFAYGRTFFTTAQSMTGVATSGIRSGDFVALILGGDVPVIIRPWDLHRESEGFLLLCECFVRSASVMSGELVQAEKTRAREIILI